MSDDFDGDGEREQAGEQERAEAEALAAALDGKPHAQDAPEDALAAALLVRHGGHRGELSNERSEAILGALLRDARPAGQPLADAPTARAHPTADGPTAVPPAPAARSAKVVRLWPLAAGFATAAAIALAWLGAQSLRSGQPTAAAPASVAATASQPALPQPLPAASVQLLAAQTALLRAGLQRARAGESPQGAAQEAGERETEAAARFERELRAYRAELLRTLQAQYPAKLGLLGRRTDGADGTAVGPDGWRRSR